MLQLYHVSPFLRETLTKIFYCEEFNEHGLLLDPERITVAFTTSMTTLIEKICLLPVSSQGWDRTNFIRNPSLREGQSRDKYRRLEIVSKEKL